jgi:hypothetical protein
MKKILSLIVIVGAAWRMEAQQAGFQIALLPECALHDSETLIHGVTWNIICGENPQEGVTLGFYNIITGDSRGFSWGAINHSDAYTGVHWGIVNWNDETFKGWQSGLINYTGTKFTGFQWGALNVAKECRGFQLGVFNYAHRLNGLQIGALNIVAENHWFTAVPRQFAAAWPIVNWSF